MVLDMTKVGIPPGRNVFGKQIWLMRARTFSRGGNFADPGGYGTSTVQPRLSLRRSVRLRVAIVQCAFDLVEHGSDGRQIGFVCFTERPAIDPILPRPLGIASNLKFEPRL